MCLFLAHDGLQQNFIVRYATAGEMEPFVSDTRRHGERLVRVPVTASVRAGPRRGRHEPWWPCTCVTGSSAFHLWPGSFHFCPIMSSSSWVVRTQPSRLQLAGELPVGPERRVTSSRPLPSAPSGLWGSGHFKSDPEPSKAKCFLSRSGGPKRDRGGTDRV